MLRVLLLACAVLLSTDALAAKGCQGRADVVFEMVAARAAITSSLAKEPRDGALGEPWRYQLLLHGEALTNLGVPGDKQEEIAKSVMDVSFSANPEIETDIFTEYYFLACEKEKANEPAVPLSSIAKESLLACWNNVANRKEFQQCVGPLLRATPSGSGEAAR